MIVGLGVDIVEVPRMRATIERRGERFLKRAFTAGEQAYCLRSQCPERRFAARFAAKEAVMKALGKGWTQGMRFHEIETTRNEDGKPGVRLSGSTAARAAELGVRAIHVSMTHGLEIALAYVVAEGDASVEPQ